MVKFVFSTNKRSSRFSEKKLQRRVVYLCEADDSGLPKLPLDHCCCEIWLLLVSCVKDYFATGCVQFHSSWNHKVTLI